MRSAHEAVGVAGQSIINYAADQGMVGDIRGVKYFLFEINQYLIAYEILPYS